MIMMYWLTGYNKCTTLVKDIDGGGRLSMCEIRGYLGNLSSFCSALLGA